MHTGNAIRISCKVPIECKALANTAVEQNCQRKISRNLVSCTSHHGRLDTAFVLD